MQQLHGACRVRRVVHIPHLHHHIAATGSTRMGREVGPRVAARFGRSILELGGNNAMILAPSADLDLAVAGAVGGAMGATGQKCTATRRVIAVGDVHDELLEQMATAVEALQVGDGREDGTEIGPLVSAGARTEVAKAVDAAIAEARATIEAATRR